MKFQVTKTQKLIIATALAAVDADLDHANQGVLEDVARAMLVIQSGGMQAYVLNGFEWSCRVRGRREPERVAEDRSQLGEAVLRLHGAIDEAKGEAACRIRGNRARRIREIEREAEALREQADLRRVILRARRNGMRMLGGGRGPDKLQVVAV